MNTQNTPNIDIIDTDQNRFMQDVIEESKHRPIIVDFWAPWCGPCKQLMPILEKYVKASNASMRLAKINIDENKMLADQLQVQSVPTVYAFKNGQPVNGFTGAQPADKIKAFIASLLDGENNASQQAQELVTRAQESLSMGDIGGAAQDFSEALQIDSENIPARVALIRIYLEQNNEQANVQAQALLDNASSDVQKHEELTALRTKLNMRQNNSSDTNDTQKLAQNCTQNPKDLDARFAYAKSLLSAGQDAKAIEELLTSIRQDRTHNEQEARKFLVGIFATLDHKSKILHQGRKDLSRILFS